MMRSQSRYGSPKSPDYAIVMKMCFALNSYSLVSSIRLIIIIRTSRCPYKHLLVLIRTKFCRGAGASHRGVNVILVNAKNLTRWAALRALGSHPSASRATRWAGFAVESITPNPNPNPNPHPIFFYKVRILYQNCRFNSKVLINNGFPKTVYKKKQ